jgi:lipid-A-disaccharide synthase
MNYYIIAGEASGDLHAANLIKALKKGDPSAHFRAWGGDRMADQGAEVVKHYKDLAFMGFVEVIKNLSTIFKNLKFCKTDILFFDPDVLILVDYPGFNLRIAKWAHAIGIKVFYYISPQIWAWKQSRVKEIRANVDKMFVILPFEKNFYRQFDVLVDFVGHPLLDAIQEENEIRLLEGDNFKIDNKLDNRPIIALLPGSREQEISEVLQQMLGVLNDFPDYQFVIAGVGAVNKSFYKEIIGTKDVKLSYGKTHDLLHNAAAALVTSGTATLETALLNVPEVVCYKGSYISYLIARQLIKVKYISLVNLIMDREVVKELIQVDLNKENIRRELEGLLFDSKKREKIFADYEALRQILGGHGASEKAARLILSYLK